MPATNTTKKRVTLHNQRTSRRTGKAFTTKHNDRNFDTTQAKHIDQTRIENNIYWRWDAPSPYQPKNGVKHKTFDKAEDEFYKAMFSTFLESKNRRRRASRHKTQTMRQYRKNRISCPEETLFYIGNRSNHVEPELLTEVLKEYIAWQKQCVAEMLRLIKDNGVVFYNNKNRVQHGLLEDRSEILRDSQPAVLRGLFLC